MAETIVNELATFWITAKFFDKNSSGATPVAISWKVYDALDGIKLSSGTETPSTSVEVQVDAANNAIRHNKAYERRRLNVLATFTTGQQPGEKSWLVKNLGFTQST